MMRFLIEKEFKQFFRNPILPRLALMFPCMVMLVFPWAADMEVKNIRFAVVDNDHSTSSARLRDKVEASAYFDFSGSFDSYDQALETIERGSSDAVLEIPLDFEKKLMQNGASEIIVYANAVNGIKGGLSGAYLSSIAGDFSRELTQRLPPRGANPPAPQILIEERNVFNPYLNYQYFMIPALIVMVVTMICGFFPALNIVSEKEVGTIEQINVTPVSKFQFIVSKLTPYWLFGFLILSICFLLAWAIYGLLPASGFGMLYLSATVYVLAVSGMGLIISNYSETMQQAMFVMFFFMIVFTLTSGLFTPISNMPQWAQWLTVINPLKYFTYIMRSVYLRGSTLAELQQYYFALLVFAGILNGWAIWSYRKSSR